MQWTLSCEHSESICHKYRHTKPDVYDSCFIFQITSASLVMTHAFIQKGSLKIVYHYLKNILSKGSQLQVKSQK